MNRDDRLKRYQDVGAVFLEAAVHKAEEFLSEMSNLGEATGRQAGARVDDIVDGGRRGTDLLVDTIRREIASQLAGLGLATRADLEAVERRLTALATPQAAEAPTGKAPAQKVPARKTPAKKTPAPEAPAQKTPAQKTAAKKTAAKKTAAKKTAAKKAPAGKTASRTVPAAGKATGTGKTAAGRAGAS